MTRIRPPLAVADAMAIRKRQGMTMDRAIVDSGRAETAAVLTYVAISRVRTAEGLASVDGGCITRSRLAQHYKFLKLRKRGDDGMKVPFDAQQQPAPSADNLTPAERQSPAMLHRLQTQGAE